MLSSLSQKCKENSHTKHTKVYYKLLFLSRKRSQSQTFKKAAPKIVCSSLYVISTTCWINVFILCGHQKASFFVRVYSYRTSHSEVFLRNGVLKICSKFPGEYPCRSVISITLQSNFIEIALRCECSPVNLLHIFRTPFSRNSSEWLLLFLLSSLLFVCLLFVFVLLCFVVAVVSKASCCCVH